MNKYMNEQKIIEILETELKVSRQLNSSIISVLDCTTNMAKKLLGDLYEDLINDELTQFEDNLEEPDNQFIEFSVSKFLSLYYINKRNQKFNNLL